MLNRLARRTEPNKLLFLGELFAGGGTELKPKMDELVMMTKIEREEVSHLQFLHCLL